MKNFSSWASSNIQTSRWLIVLCHVLLVGLAIIIGFFTYNLDIKLPAWTLQTAFVLFALAIFYYPFKNTFGKWSKNYYFRKSLDLVLVIMGFLMTTIGFNQFCHAPLNETMNVQEIVVPRAEFMINVPAPIVKGNAKFGLFSTLKKAKKEFRKNIKAKIKTARKALRTNRQKTISVGMQIFLIFISVLIGILAFLVIAILGCSVACSGAEGLGVAILLLGLVGVIVALFFIIRSIIRKGVNYKGKKKNSLEESRV